MRWEKWISLNFICSNVNWRRQPLVCHVNNQVSILKYSIQYCKISHKITRSAQVSENWKLITIKIFNLYVDLSVISVSSVIFILSKISNFIINIKLSSNLDEPLEWDKIKRMNKLYNHSSSTWTDIVKIRIAYKIIKIYFKVFSFIDTVRSQNQNEENSSFAPFSSHHRKF